MPVLGHAVQPALPVLLAVGRSRRNCTHANEHASATVSTDAITLRNTVLNSTR